MVGKSLGRYIQIWWQTSWFSVQAVLVNRWGALLFLAGKLARFILFIVFLKLITNQVQLAGYSFSQLLTFFLIFNLFDLWGQIFFRGIYWFRNQVVSGEFDFALIAPVNALFRILTQHTDILDLPLFLLTGIIVISQGFSLSWFQGVNFSLVVIAGLMIVTAIHIVVAALGVVTTEVDHTMLIYRDISAMARVPIDIYTDHIRAVLTFVIPVAIAYTLPAKALLGWVHWPTVLSALATGIISLTLALRLWDKAIKHYTSVSS